MISTNLINLKIWFNKFKIKNYKLNNFKMKMTKYYKNNLETNKFNKI